MNDPSRFVIDCRMAKGDSPPSIRLFDSIGRRDTGKGTSSEEVSAFLAENQRAPSVEVFINSTGGYASEGIAMFDVLRRFPGEVVTINGGMALSAAALVFLAGSRRLMSPGSYLMVHRASAKVEGNADIFRRAATSLEDIDSSVAGVMGERICRTAGDVLKMMAAETWFTVDEAIRQRFATGRTGSNQSISATFDLNRFANVPPALAQWKNATATSSGTSLDRFAIRL